MNRLQGKVAIVTGASRGIGRATAKLFAEEGAKVVVASRTKESVEAVAEEIRWSGASALAFVCDIADPDQVVALIEHAVATYGGIDILVNNAFDPSAVSASIADVSIEQLQRNFDMGPIAYLRTMQACHPHLKASGAGRVVNLGSMAGVLGMVGYGPYNMAKEAVRALTRTAAREWGADGITVNTLLPVAETWDKDMEVPAPSNPLGRYGDPEKDIAPVILFLASEDARFVTGYSLAADGGHIIDSAR